MINYVTRNHILTKRLNIIKKVSWLVIQNTFMRKNTQITLI